MPPMSAKKTRLTLAMILCLVAIGGGLSWLLRTDIVIVGLESPLSAEAKRSLFEKHRHEISYPESATEVCFRLEPGLYKDGDVYGEYVRFKGSDEVIQAFVQSTLGLESQTENPLPYSQWHQGVGNYPWWQPMAVQQPTFYEKDRRFITVDPDQGLVFYSYVRSYSVLKKSAVPVRE
jgi:hypothetical protein